METEFVPHKLENANDELTNCIEKHNLLKSANAHKEQYLAKIQEYLQKITQKNPGFSRTDVVVIVHGIAYMGETYYGPLSSQLLEKYKFLEDFSNDSVQCYYAGEELEKIAEAARKKPPIEDTWLTSKNRPSKDQAQAKKRHQKVVKEGSWTEDQVDACLIVVVGKRLFRNGEVKGGIQYLNREKALYLEKFSDSSVKCYWQMSRPIKAKIIKDKMEELKSVDYVEGVPILPKNIVLVIDDGVYIKGVRKGDEADFDLSSYVFLEGYSNEMIKCYVR